MHVALNFNVAAGEVSLLASCLISKAFSDIDLNIKSDSGKRGGSHF